MAVRHLGSLNNRRVLVTGAAGGIGAALCRQLVQGEGAELIAVDVQAERLNQLRDELQRSQSPAVATLAVDLTAPEAPKAILQALDGRPLHVLVNNAGVVHSGTFLNMDVADIDAMLALNLAAAVRLTHTLLPLLVASRPAHIVNVASLAGLAAPAGLAAYAASKFGLVGFAEALRAELQEHGVGVTTICPGFVQTPLIANSTAARHGVSPIDQARAAALEEALAGLGITAERVAKAIVRAILTREALVVLGHGARPLRAVRALSPALWSMLSRTAFRYLRSRGALE